MRVVVNREQLRALWKARCELFLLGDPGSKSHDDLSVRECSYNPSCERQAHTILHNGLCEQFKLYSVVDIFQFDCYCWSLCFPLESRLYVTVPVVWALNINNSLRTLCRRRMQI